MAIEIEKKFLVQNLSWQYSIQKRLHLRQGYLTLGKANLASIRVRTAGNAANINIKSAVLGIFRHEYEYAIPLDDATEILETLCIGSIVEKNRFVVNHHNHMWEIDVFEGENKGLIVAEIELSNEEEEFSFPPWLGKEISFEERYYNASLAQLPYSRWK